MVSVKFRFEGLPAHASISPHQGKSALDAVELMSVGVNYMREHVKEDTRIHYVITNGGGQPNVVPPTPRSGITCAPTSTPTSRSTSCGCTEIARAAAAMSRTKLIETRVDADMHEVLPNRTLVEVIQKNLELVGPPKFDDREKAFARATQKDLKPQPALALAERVEPLPAGPPEQGTALHRRRRPDLVLPGRPVHRRDLQLRRARTQLADRGLHRHEHRREGHDGRRQDALRRSAIDLYRSPAIDPAGARRSEEDDGGTRSTRR